MAIRRSTLLALEGRWRSDQQYTSSAWLIGSTRL